MRFDNHDVLVRCDIFLPSRLVRDQGTPILAASELSLGCSPFTSGNILATGGTVASPSLAAAFVEKGPQDRITLAADDQLDRSNGSVVSEIL